MVLYTHHKGWLKEKHMKTIFLQRILIYSERM